MKFNGSCHCGGIAFEVEGDLQSVIECNCSICTKRGYLLWFVPRDKVRLTTPESNFATYTFNTHRIQHHFCPRCGCAPYGVGTDQSGNAMAAVNVRCLEGVDVAALKRRQFDGRKL